MQKITKCLRALANERRLKILRELKQTEPLTVNAIAKRINLSIKSTSKHLQKLAECGFVNRAQVSLQVWYRLNRKHELSGIILKHLN